MAGFLGDGAPLPDKGGEKWWKIRGPRGEERIAVVLLGSAYIGLNTHFDGVTRLHYEDRACPGCDKRLPIRWHGYIAAYDVHAKSEFVLSLTEGAARRVIQIAEEHGRMRGLHLVVSRTRAPKGAVRRNAAVQVEYVGILDAAKIPSEFPVRPSLVRLFDGNDRKVDQATQQREPIRRHRQAPRPNDRYDWIPEAG